VSLLGFEGIHVSGDDIQQVSMTPVLGFLVRNLYRTPHYPPNKNAREFKLQRCLKDFFTTESLTQELWANHYKKAKTSALSITWPDPCQPVSTLNTYYTITIVLWRVVYTWHFWLMIITSTSFQTSRGRANKKNPLGQRHELGCNFGRRRTLETIVD